MPRWVSVVSTGTMTLKIKLFRNPFTPNHAAGVAEQVAVTPASLCVIHFRPASLDCDAIQSSPVGSRVPFVFCNCLFVCLFCFVVCDSWQRDGEEGSITNIKITDCTAYSNPLGLGKSNMPPTIGLDELRGGGEKRNWWSPAHPKKKKKNEKAHLILYNKWAVAVVPCKPTKKSHCATKLIEELGVTKPWLAGTNNNELRWTLPIDRMTWHITLSRAKCTQKRQQLTAWHSCNRGQWLCGWWRWAR